MEKRFYKSRKCKDNNSYNKYLIKKDSFSDRFCDDLTEVVLSYLSFEDKIRFECVSQQFQRLIFNKQNSLELDKSLIGNENTLNVLIRKLKSGFYVFSKNTLNFDAFRNVLRKCQFINNIRIDINFFDKTMRERLLKLIIKYCRLLKSIEFRFDEINEDILRQFGQKFGKSLITIGFIDPYINRNNFKQLLKLCPKVVSINDRISLLSLFVENNESFLPKLTKVSIKFESKDCQLLESFTNNYNNSIKCLIFQIIGGFDENKQKNVMKQISSLKVLEDLQFIADMEGKSEQVFTDGLKAIGINCNHLKRLKLDVMNLRSDSVLNRQIFQSMQFYKFLSHLELDLYSYESNELTSKAFKECKQLTHLKINYPKINNCFFTDIHKNLAQLKCLKLLLFNITDKAFKSLSKMKKLHSIFFFTDIRIDSDDEDIYDTMPSVTDSGLLLVIKKCPEMKSIRFHFRPNITRKTIDALITLAFNKPKIQFNHEFKLIGDEDSIHQSFDIIKLYDFHFPNNLIIK